MDIRFKNDKVDIAITNIDKDIIHHENEMDNIINIIKVLQSFEFTDTMQKTVTAIQEKKEQPKNIQTSVDRPVIRDRLPNTVDLSELEMKKAVTEEPMVRCPECGQSSTVLVEIDDTHNYLMRKVVNEKKETFETVMELTSEKDINNILMPASASPLDYHNDIMKIKIPKKLKDVDINVSNETKICCPVCGNSAHTFKEWVEAFKHPLDFGFETENLCDVCGQEAVNTFDENKNEVIVCESCGSKKNIVK